MKIIGIVLILAAAVALLAAFNAGKDGDRKTQTILGLGGIAGAVLGVFLLLN